MSYLLRALGYQVTANDFLHFPAAIIEATVVNQGVTPARTPPRAAARLRRSA